MTAKKNQTYTRMVKIKQKKKQTLSNNEDNLDLLTPMLSNKSEFSEFLDTIMKRIYNSGIKA